MRIGVRRRVDVIACALLFGLTLLVFAPGARSLGFYADDAGFLDTLGAASLTDAVDSAGAYVPGRWLHMIWQWSLFQIAGSGPESLPALHLLQSLLDAIAVVLLFVVGRQLGLPISFAALAAILFAFYPNHAETHFWLSAAPMNLASTVFSLLFLIALIRVFRIEQAGNRNDIQWQRPAWYLVELLSFALAMFTYDQPFLLLSLAVAVRAGAAVWTAQPEYRRQVLLRWCGLSLPHASAAMIMIWVKLQPVSGPTLTHLGPLHIAETAARAVLVHCAMPFHSAGREFLKLISGHEFLIIIGLTTLSVAILQLLQRLDHAAPVWLGTRSSPPSKEAAQIPMAAGQGHVGNHKKALVLTCAGLSMMVTGYGPTLAWYISARHNYLPSAGLALAVAAAAWWISEHAQWRQSAHRSRRLIHPLMNGGLVALIFIGLGNCVLEKRVWAEAYAIRQQFYQSLLEQHRAEQVLIFRRYPKYHLGRAPLFVHEHVESATRFLSGGSLVQRGFFEHPHFPLSDNGQFVSIGGFAFAPEDIRYAEFDANEQLRPRDLQRLPPLLPHRSPADELTDSR